MNPWMIVLIQTALGVLISPIVNSLATFGEEFGSRVPAAKAHAAWREEGHAGFRRDLGHLALAGDLYGL